MLRAYWLIESVVNMRFNIDECTRGFDAIRALDTNEYKRERRREKLKSQNAININITYIFFLNRKPNKKQHFSQNNIVMHRTTHDMFWAEAHAWPAEIERERAKRLLNFPFNVVLKLW